MLRAELELIRVEMGRPSEARPAISVDNVSPREVLFQARALFRKTDRLCFEQTRERAEVPQLPSGAIESADVLAVVEAAHERLRRVKANLAIEASPPVASSSPDKTPTDIYRAIVQANRQTNLLLDRPFSPSDVYQEVTRAIAYASRLLAHFPGATRIPSPPDFERGKRPADVYRRLASCFQRLHTVAAISGLEMLTFVDEGLGNETVSPSDVYDVATLVVSELAYFDSRLETGREPREVYFPGRKLPSHAFQRAGILERQLEELTVRVQEQPDWLGGRTGKP